MTYKPARRVSFGPPLGERWASLVYLAFALTVAAVIVYGQMAPSNTTIFRYVVEGDRHRIVSSSTCAIILLASALAAFLREQMRGVVIHPDGLELRELLPLGWPRVRRYHWSQIDRVFVPASVAAGASEGGEHRSIRLDLWDGSHTFLPRVRKEDQLGVLLERVALARAIPLEGGSGILDDLGNPLED
jgi:hypothetical protein